MVNYTEQEEQWSISTVHRTATLRVDYSLDYNDQITIIQFVKWQDDY